MTAAKKPTITRRRTGWFCWTCADTIATSWAGMQRHIDTEHGGGRIETGPDRPKEARESCE